MYLHALKQAEKYLEDLFTSEATREWCLRISMGEWATSCE
jgi:hypothetical protein